MRAETALYAELSLHCVWRVARQQARPVEVRASVESSPAVLSVRTLGRDGGGQILRDRP